MSHTLPLGRIFMLSEQIMLILSEKQVEALIDMDELIAALERAHIQYSTGKAVMPVRLVVPLGFFSSLLMLGSGFLFLN
jgi:ornithine cyclodeaminase/alanine dehydrogenase-like protein (mu-crystallin family)